MAMADVAGVQERKLEGVETELQQSQSDLQLAFKRISDLQATIEDEIHHESDDEYSDDRSDLLTYSGHDFTHGWLLLYPVVKQCLQEAQPRNFKMRCKTGTINKM